MSASESPSPQARKQAALAFNEAARAHQQGDLLRAEMLCVSVVNADPAFAPAWHMRGLIALSRGDERGAAWIEHSLGIDPLQPAAHANLGNFFLGQGKPELALPRLEQALMLKPDHVAALYNRGNALRALKRREEALESYESALRHQPSHWMAHNNRGLLLMELGRPAEARGAFKAAAALVAQAEPLKNLAGAYFALGDWREARASFERALAFAPQDAALWHGLGNAYFKEHQAAAAFECYSKALNLQPNDPELLISRCAAALGLGRAKAALDDAELALARGANSPLLRNNLGNAWLALGKPAAALLHYEAALSDDPHYPDAQWNRLCALRRLARPEEALEACEALLLQDPGHRHAAGLRFQLRMDCARWDGYAEELERFEQCAADPGKIVNPMSALLVDSPRLQRLVAERFVAERVPQTLSPWTAPPRARGARLRIAYISADFREHPVASLLVGVLEAHDRSAFEIIGVSLAASDGSVLALRVRNACDQFVEAEDEDLERLVERLRELRIDVAVDLMGFTQGERYALFVQRIAAVQVGYLGFAGTTSRYMDYLLADSVALPHAEERHFAERVWRLPHCLLPNDAARVVAARPTREQAGLPQQGAVLCAFSNTCKINPPLYERWMQLLKDLPGSILWLRDVAHSVRERLQRAAEALGVERDRLVFAPRISGEAEHLARLGCADLFLDTSPYNAHSTACDALWAGVPVITHAGKSFASRIAASALNAAGLPELVCASLDEYQQVALDLLRSPERLAARRVHLAQARQLPLFQTLRYTRDLELSYTRMALSSR